MRPGQPHELMYEMIVCQHFRQVRMRDGRSPRVTVVTGHQSKLAGPKSLASVEYNYHWLSVLCAEFTLKIRLELQCTVLVALTRRCGRAVWQI